MLLGVLSCTEGKKCEDINDTITLEQNSIDMSFAERIGTKHAEIQQYIFDDKLPYEEREEKIQKSNDSLYKIAYQQLKENKTFKEKGLYGNISRIGRMILLYNKKFKELYNLLQNNPCFTTFDDKILKEQVAFLAYKKDDYLKAKEAKSKANRMIKEKLLKKSERDTIEDMTLYYHYVVNKAIFEGKEAGYQTVDSLVKVNKMLEGFSNDMKEQCNIFAVFMSD